MNGRHKPRFVTLREYPHVGPLQVRLLEDETTGRRCLDLREWQHGKGFSRYGVRIWTRDDIETLWNVLTAALRDPPDLRLALWLGTGRGHGSSPGPAFADVLVVPSWWRSHRLLYLQ